MSGALRLLLTVAVIATAALPALEPRRALACSCVDSQPEEAFQVATDVFAGTVTRIDGEPGAPRDLVVHFEVSRVWKGAEQRQVTVTTPAQGSACGYTFVAGFDYVVYALRAGSALTTNSCSGTHGGGSPLANEATVFGEGEPLSDAPFVEPGDSSSVLVVLLYAGVPIVVLAVGAAAVVWWRHRA